MPPQFSFRGPLLPDFVRLNGRWYPGKAAIVDEEKSLSWGELDRASNAVANGLRALGVRNGDAVAILLENCGEYVEMLYGLWKAGAVAVPLNLAVNESGLLGMLRDAGARALFCSPQQRARLGSQLNGVSSLLDGAVIEHGPTAGYNQWKRAQSTEPPDVVIGDDDPINIIYSSGTTAQPKGIKHVHRRRLQSLYELALGHRYHYGAVAICPIGLYSNVAWSPLLCSLIVGGTLIVRRGFDAECWVQDVAKYRVTHTMMVPIMFQRVLEAPNFSPAAVQSLQAVVSGGSPLFEHLKRRIMENFRCVVIELYGLTEGFMTMLQPDEAEGRLASVGKPVRGNDYLLLDEHDQPQPWGGTGEICVRSVHGMLEYHNRPDATRDAMYIDPAGRQWLRTGDVGRTDAQGYLYIVDRKKDMILSGGQNIYPADIESVMSTHPQVGEVAVIGIPDERWGETPVAVVVARGQADANEIRDWTNERVGKPQRIKDVRLVAAMPRNPNGKVLKRELRACQPESQSASARRTGPSDTK